MQTWQTQRLHTRQTRNRAEFTIRPACPKPLLSFSRLQDPHDFHAAGAIISLAMFRVGALESL